MPFEKYTIRDFINAMFNGERSIMDEDTLQTVYTEYVDVAGLYETADFNLSVYINFLTVRVNMIKKSILAQKQYTEEFGIAYLPGINVFKQYGHKIKWTNKEDFFKSLDKMETREKVYISQLEAKVKEREELREKNNKGEVVSEKLKRGSFIRTINTLGKIGYKIDNDKTTIEELAYMIKQQIEESKKAA
jgi:hypothetical protein